jgi:hypothetical protein
MRVTKSRRMRLGEIRNACNILVGKSEAKR